MLKGRKIANSFSGLSSLLPFARWHDCLQSENLQILPARIATWSISPILLSLPGLLLHNRPLRKPFTICCDTSPPVKSRRYIPIHIPILPHSPPKKVLPHILRIINQLFRNLLAIISQVPCGRPTGVDDVRSCWIL